MAPRSGILAAGNWLIDRVKLIDSWPPQDSIAYIQSESASNGGGPFNVLQDLARLCAPFPLAGIGVVGDDADGRWIRAECQARGIDTTRLHTTQAAPTSYTDVMTVAGTGRRTFFHQRGANALFAPEHCDFSSSTAKRFHLAYLLLLDRMDAFDAAGQPSALHVMRRARAAGMCTSLDCVSENSDRFRTVVAPVLPEVDILFANDFEVERLTGIRVEQNGMCDREAIVRAGRQLLAMGVREWVIIHLPGGAQACSVQGEARWQPSVAVPATEIRGTAGAGDAFAAGVLFGLHEDWSMARALELGVCAAASSLYHPTCSESVKPAAECLELGRTLGFL
jgi:sugar/nucleoside kinase (ribokinase family)